MTAVYGSVTIAVLNSIRNSASAEYVARIPTATRDNITAIGNTLSTYTILKNEFTTNLVEKIGLTIFSSKMATNRLARFKKGKLEHGMDIEEIFISMAKAEGSFDKDGLNVFGRRKPEVLVKYHRRNRMDSYVITVSDAQIRTAFVNENGVQSLLSGIVESMYSGCNYDEYVMMKELLGSYALNYVDYGVADITDNATGKEFVKSVSKAVADMSFMSKKFNKAGVVTQSDLKDMVLIVNKDVLCEISVEVLASAFNMSEVGLKPEIVVVDDFGSMTTTFALLVDKDFFMVYDTITNLETARNPQGMFTNYFLNVQQILSLSQFKNAVRFTTVPKVDIP